MIKLATFTDVNTPLTKVLTESCSKQNCLKTGSVPKTSDEPKK